MSLIYSQITKKTAIVASDTRALDILPDGTEIILNDETPKVLRGNNFLIGLSGDGRPISNVLNELFKKDSDGLSDFSPDRVGKIVQKYHKEYVDCCQEQGKKLPKNTDGSTVSFGIMIIGIKDNKVVRYIYMPKDNGNCDIRIDSVADEDADGRQLINLFGCTSPEMDQWGLEHKDMMGSLDFIRALYTEFESNEVGGYLVVNQLSVDDGVKRILIEPIPTKGGYVYEGDSSKC